MVQLEVFVIEDNVYITDLAIKYQQNREKKKKKGKTQQRHIENNNSQCKLKKNEGGISRGTNSCKVKRSLGENRTNDLKNSKNVMENVLLNTKNRYLLRIVQEEKRQSTSESFIQSQ